MIVEVRAVPPKGRDDAEGMSAHDQDWNFPFEAELHAIAPGLHEAQNAWLSQIDSLEAPDRKTHELIRMVCTVIIRNPPGIARHAMLAAEVGATWEEIVGSILLTEPSFGLLRVVEALPYARRGYERARADGPVKHRGPAAKGANEKKATKGPGDKKREAKKGR